MSAGPPLDVKKALSWVDGDRELLEELVGLFLEDLPARRAELAAAVVGRDSGAALRVAHTLRGSLTPLGAVRAAALALDLEVGAREGRLDGTANTLDGLLTELDRITAFLADPAWCRDA